mgnify:CR=1 FL=1
MVGLRNIILTDNRLSCDYLPDCEDAGGHITIDATTYEIIKIVAAQYESSNSAMYISLARRRLIELLQSGEPLPERAAIAIF